MDQNSVMQSAVFLSSIHSKMKHIYIYILYNYIYIICVSTYRRIYNLPTYLPSYLPISIYLSIYLPTYLCICLSICLSVHLSIYLSIHPSIDPSIHPSIHPSVCLSVCISFFLYPILVLDFCPPITIITVYRLEFFPVMGVSLSNTWDPQVMTFIVPITGVCGDSISSLAPLFVKKTRNMGFTYGGFPKWGYFEIIHLDTIFYYRRKFGSQTSDNMER